MNGKFFPAIWTKDFPDTFFALASLGIVGDESEFLLAGLVVGSEVPVIINVEIHDPDARLSNLPSSLAPLVLLRRPSGAVGLWLAAFNHLAETRDAALSGLVDELLSGELDDMPPTIDVFQITEPERMTLQ